VEEHRKSSHLFLPHLMPGQPMGWCFAFRTKSRDGGAAAEDKKKKAYCPEGQHSEVSTKKEQLPRGGRQKNSRTRPEPGVESSAAPASLVY